MLRKSSLVGVLLVVWIMVFSCVTVANEKVSGIFVDTDLRDVLNTIAYDAGVNIFLDQTIEGITTCEFKDTPLEEALNMVCVSGGFRYIQVENYYIIMVPDPDNPLFQRYAKREVVYLNYARAKDIVTLLKSYAPYLQAGESDRSIMVTALPGEMKNEIVSTVKALDVAGKQIEVQILITEVSEKSFREFGLGNLEVAWGNGLEKLGEIFSVSIGPFTFGATSQNDLRSALTLRILSERDEAKITGSPKIRVLEGHEAYIKLGEERHILPVLEKGTGTGFYTTYIEKEEVKAESGLKVSISRVTSENEIIFKSVEMNLEEILETLQQTSSGEIIRVNKRSAGTTLILRNHETIPIGSMTVEREKKKGRFPPYTSSEKELVRLDLYMTASVVGTLPPPGYEGLEKFAEGLKLKIESPKKQGFITKHPVLTLAILYGVYAITSQ